MGFFMTRRLAIIGSFELRKSLELAAVGTERVSTPYGTVEVSTYGADTFALCRGKAGLAAHAVNHRANISALLKLGVTDVIATAMVGALNPDTPIGEMLLLDQFLDFTKRTPERFYTDDGFRDFDFSHPFCNRIRSVLYEEAQVEQMNVRNSGCYVGVDGPRFETAAEVRMYGDLGGDVVGMTIVQECIMARESGLCYAAVAGVVNAGAGLTGKSVVAHDFLEPGEKHVANIAKLVSKSAGEISGGPADTCSCGQDVVRRKAATEFVRHLEEV